MDRPDTPQARKAFLRNLILRIVFLYVLVPVLLLVLLAKPIGSAACRSDAAVFLILLAAAAAAGLNWFVYTLLYHKRPPLPAFAHGLFIVTAVAFIEQEALPAYYALQSTLAVIIGFLALLSMLLLSFWFASLRSRPAHVIAVGLRIAVGVVLFFMAYQIIRDIEIRNVTWNTWITAGVLVVIVLVRFSPRLFSAFRSGTSRRRATGLTEGRIVQIVGETHLDLDGDPVTLQHARIQYTVDDVPYEIRTGISRYTTRRFGKAAFVGRTVPVSYDPANPASAHTRRIDRHFFDQQPENSNPPEDENIDSPETPAV